MTLLSEVKRDDAEHAKTLITAAERLGVRSRRAQWRLPESVRSPSVAPDDRVSELYTGSLSPSNSGAAIRSIKAAASGS